MKIALMSDSHYGIRNDNLSFYPYQKKSNEFFFDIIRKNRIKHCIHLGDLFDRRKYVNYLTASTCASDLLQPLQNLGIKTWILAGNHDEYYKDNHAPNSLRELVSGRYSNIQVVDTPELVVLGDRDIQLMPWITDSNKEQSLAALNSPKASILMGHLEVKGFEMLVGNVANVGFNPDVFSGFDLVLSGHYHHRSSHNNVHYIGAAYEFIWSDFNDPRGFSVLDVETLKLDFYRNPHSIFQMYMYNDSDPDIMQKAVLEGDFSPYNGNYVKIVVVEKQDPFLFDMFLDRVEKANPIDVKIIEEGFEVHPEMEDDANIVVDDTKTVIHKHIDNLPNIANKQTMKGLMDVIYSQAISLEGVE
jgi:DNA repair exonuclease SbcCD nuclease subunit